MGTSHRWSIASSGWSAKRWNRRSGRWASIGKLASDLITSLFAREVIVGTLGTIYGIEGDEQSAGLQQAIHHDLNAAGAVALLIFFAFAMQCFSTIAIVKRETGGWKWPIFQFSYMLVLAYAGSFVAYQIGSYFLGK